MGVASLSEEIERGVPVDPEEQLQARVAWHYFVGNLTQQQIANRLGTSRVRVNRLLAACRENGVVQISITSRLASCVALEESLRERFGLREAVVVPTPEQERYVQDAIGVGAGTYLSRHLRGGLNVGIGWGRTLRSVIRALPARPLDGLSVVSLQGGLSHCSRINTFEIVSDFADLFGADRHFFAAPIYASSEQARDILLEQEAIRETYDKAKAADLAVVTAGDLTQSLIVEYAVSDPADLRQLQQAGAVGDVIGNFIDADGRPVDHPLNRRTVGLSIDDLKRLPHVVMVSGAAHKIAVTRAALSGGFVDVLVTDEATAEALAE
jgi:DNA-binding transcriptional regulator LsrR (DeoR family)